MHEQELLLVREERKESWRLGEGSRESCTTMKEKHAILA